MKSIIILLVFFFFFWLLVDKSAAKMGTSTQTYIAYAYARTVYAMRSVCKHISGKEESECWWVSMFKHDARFSYYNDRDYAF